MKKRSFGTPQLLLCIILMLLILVSATFALQKLANQSIFMDEFPINYLAAKNWLGDNRSPYDSANGNEVLSLINKNADIDSSSTINYFRYPLLTTLIIMPFTFLPIIPAKALWMAVNCVALIISSLLLLGCIRQKTPVSIIYVTALFGVLNIYSVNCILTASLKSIVFLIISITLYLLINQQDKLAGFVLSLSLIELPISIFVIIYLLIWAGINKRKSFVSNFWIGLLFQMIISLIVSPTWIIGWLRSLIQDISYKGLYASFVSQIIGTMYPHGFWLNLGIHLSLLMVLIYLWSTYHPRDGQPFIWVISLTMIITSLIMFPATLSLLIISLPPLLIVMTVWMSRWKNHGKSFFYTATGFLILVPWVAAVVGKQTLSDETNLMLYLIYPTISFCGLWWIRWWILKPDLSSNLIP